MTPFTEEATSTGLKLSSVSYALIISLSITVRKPELLCVKYESISPNIIISHYKGFAERLRSVEPDSWIFLHRSSELSSDGRRAGVQGAGDRREQRFV